ncbi:MAG: class I SAM-dependent methyltransferase [candidate division FCPU426 bacterium]
MKTGNESGQKDALLKRWRATQGQWDDAEFLKTTANAFMKLRWRRLNRRVAARLLSLGAAKPDLVDVGCAHADFFGYTKDGLGTYTGIEPSTALLPKNIQRGPSFKLLRGQAEKLPLKKDSADLVLIKEVLDHCHDPLKALAEAHRVLRPGGTLLVTLTNDKAWYKRLFPASAARIKAGQDDHLYFFDPDQVLDLARQAGFSERIEEDSHYLRLPGALEALLGKLPDPLGSALIALTDACGSLVLPGAGGSFWILAKK